MLFNSLDFAIFFPIVFVLYWIVSQKLHLRNILILVSSYVFYGWWDWRFLFSIVISSSVDFYVGNQLNKTEDVQKRKMFLYLSLLVNLGFLVYFKYTNFFIDTFVDSFRLFGKTLEVSRQKRLPMIPTAMSLYRTAILRRRPIRTMPTAMALVPVMVVCWSRVFVVRVKT